MHRVVAFYNGMMEAAWLVAITGIPLFFNKYSDNSYEPEKTYLIHSLAIVIVAAWILKVIARAQVHHGIANLTIAFTKTLRNPLSIALCIYGVVYITSSILSIDPGISFRGSRVRGLGTYTVLSCLIIFTSMLSPIVFSMRPKERSVFIISFRNR